MSSVFITLNMAARVVDFPEPVGPVINILPNGFAMAWWIISMDLPSKPRSVRVMLPERGSRIRITTFSPFLVGNVETRKSIFLSPNFVANLPSCARRASSIFRSERIFMRVTMADWRFLGRTKEVIKTPSILNLTLTLSSNGSM